MKIGPTKDAASLDAALRVGARSTGQPDAGEAAGSLEADNVRLSNASRELGSLELSVRADKVAALRKAIDEGKYQMDIEAIADNMIAEAARLIQTIGMPPGRAV
ncbi:MAG: flagellar biosynthesis anti-sigma factor FlgM [Burkholderiaceae bacterium]